MEIRWTIEEDDIEWIWDTKGTTDVPDEPKTIFENDKALAVLLLNEVIIINSHWYEKEMPEKFQKSINACVVCNDIFSWGSADCEDLPFSEIENLYKMWRMDPVWGSAVWCMIQRKELPQAPVAKTIDALGIWKLKEFNLKENYYDFQRKARALANYMK